MIIIIIIILLIIIFIYYYHYELVANYFPDTVMTCNYSPKREPEEVVSSQLSQDDSDALHCDVIIWTGRYMTVWYMDVQLT